MKMTLRETGKQIQEKKISPVELVEEYMKRIEKFDPVLQAYVSVTKERALADARMPLSPLSGIGAIIKDNIAVKSVRMSASSHMLDEYISPYDATLIEKLNGFSLLGKGNLDAFAFGASTENSGFFVTKNPWDTTRVSGGSSGGMAAAVAANIAMFGIGTDTGGSVRQPSGFCGVVGLKPTYGRVSRYGLAAMGSSLDCPGPITSCVEDAAYILSLIAGYDEKDATSMNISVPNYLQFQSIKGKRAGLPKEFFHEGLEKGVKEQIMHSVKILERLGVEILEVSLPHSSYALPVYYIITPSEISANMARYDGIRYGHTTTAPKDLMDLYLESRNIFEDEVKRRIFIGNYALSAGYYDAYYNKAMQVRTLIIQEMHQVFEKVDFIIGPTSPSTAFKIGEKANDPLAMYLADIYTVHANIAGIPAISIPCGLSEGLPVGVQILGKQFNEKTILDVAYALESEIAFGKNVPHIYAS